MFKIIFAKSFILNVRCGSQVLAAGRSKLASVPSGGAVVAAAAAPAAGGGGAAAAAPKKEEKKEPSEEEVS